MVMAVRNEEDHIVDCIKSILAQEVDRELQIVIADGRSTDATRQLISSIASPVPIVVVDNPAQGTAAGLNRALAASDGDIIVRCDGHAVLPPAYIRTALEVLNDPEIGPQIGMVGARALTVGRGFVQRGIAAAMSNPVGVGNSKFRYSDQPGFVDTAFLGVFRREVLDAVGGYDESLERNEDYELNMRIRRAGYKIYYEPRLAVEYYPRASLGALASQYFQYGSWKRVVIARHPESAQPRQLAPVALVGGLLLSPVVALADKRLGLVLPLTYSAAVLAAAGVESGKRRDLAAAGAVLAIPTMHLSFGLGFILGRRRGNG